MYREPHPYLMDTIRRADRTFVAGDGNWLIDEDGAGALDFYSDNGTASLGYSSEPQRAVLERHVKERIPIHSPNLYGSVERDTAARRLCTATGMDRVFFATSGAEAVEASIKLARRTQFLRAGSVGVAQRTGIWSVRDAFHGRTYATLAAGDGPPYHREGFGQLPIGFHKFDRIEDIAENAAAVLIAPILGSHGLTVYPREWLLQLEDYCHANGILLIFDEVMTGAGRAGGITYAKRLGLRPDIIALAKGLGGGAPVAACLAQGRAADGFSPGSHFSTFGGSPLSCAFVNAMLDYLGHRDDGRGHIVEVIAKGAYLRAGLQRLGWAKNVRGDGLLWCFDLEDVDKIDFAAACLERNLLIGAFRPGPGPINVVPPLTIEVEEIEWGIARMDEAYKELKR